MSAKQTDDLQLAISQKCKLGVISKKDFQEIDLVQKYLKRTVTFMPDLLDEDKIERWIRSSGRIPIDPIHIQSES